MYLYGWQWSSKYQTSSGILKTKTRLEMRCRSFHPITLSWAELHCHGLSWCQHTPPPPHTSRWRSSCCPSSHKGGESQISPNLWERFQIAKMYNCILCQISSLKNFWMKQPVSQYKLKFCNPRCQVPMLRICCPPWGVSPAVTLVPQTSELPGPQKMQIQSWSQKPWTFVPRKRAKNWKTMSA